MDNHFYAGIHARYRVHTRRADGSIKQSTPWFDNLITATGLDYFLMGDTRFPVAVAGSGTAEPTLADTKLTGYLGKSGSPKAVKSTVNTDTSPYSVTKSLTFRFDPGSFGDNANIAEVGIALGSDATATTPIISRALVTDETGKKTVISVLKDESVDIEWAVTLSLKESSGTFKMTIDGSEKEFRYTIKPANMSQSEPGYGWGMAGSSPGLTSILVNTQNGNTCAHATQELGPITQTVNGAAKSSACSKAWSEPYTSGSFFRDYTLTFDLDAANFSIGAFTILLNAFAVQMRIDPVVEKTATKTFAWTFRASLTNT